jgi:hypothetical protein
VLAVATNPASGGYGLFSALLNNVADGAVKLCLDSKHHGRCPARNRRNDRRQPRPVAWQPALGDGLAYGLLTYGLLIDIGLAEMP